MWCHIIAAMFHCFNTPPLRTVRALLTHTAPSYHLSHELCFGLQTATGYQVEQADWTRQWIALEILGEALLADAALLTTSTDPAVGKAFDRLLVLDQTGPIVIDPIVLIVSA